MELGCKPGRELSLESDQTGTVILDLQTPFIGRISVYLLLVLCCDSASGLSPVSTVRGAVFVYLPPSPHPCNSLAEALTSNVMELEGKAFGRYLV